MAKGGLSALLALFGAVSIGCDGDPAVDAGPVDSGAVDSGPIMVCPTTNVPAPEELMGPCCWRTSNQDRQDTPEMRLTYIAITAPVGSPLSTTTLRRVLNEAMQDEAFNWLMRIEGADADGEITLTTGFGRREADGTYAFSDGAAPDGDWCPVELTGTLTGETVTSMAIPGAVTVPVFDETGTTVQVELTLRQVAIDSATWTEDRSCVGFKTGQPFTYSPDGTLSGFIEVDTARGLTLDVPPIMTTVCGAVAGDLNDPTYCDTVPQGDWATPPDSLCDAAGCTVNTAGTTDVCDPATTCNAWRLVADFAAAGVDISNDACP